jgi:diguanylate cyclase (GGDEF)-like protein
LDFDRFKIVDDGMGHEFGNRLLTAVGERLQLGLQYVSAVAGHETSALAARVGADEFVVLLEGLTNAADQAVAFATDLQRRLRSPVELGGYGLRTTASVGIVAGDGYRCAEDVLRDADIAMYQAKNRGRDCHVIFDYEMRIQAALRLKMEHELRQAIERRELYVVYQPIVSLQSGELEGFEALVRWHHPERGLVSPLEFIPTAEETGLIVPIGRFVLEEACRQLHSLRQQFPQHTSLSMSVNLSKRQLLDTTLPQQVQSILAVAEVPADSLKLEVTESVIMDNLAPVIPALVELRKLGVRLSMDDFGTGHSSLSSLHQFPIDVLKIDRAFVSNMELNRDYTAIVQAIIMLAHNLGMAVVAEGIESEGQLAQLQAMDCDMGQGYYFAKPMSAEATGSFVSKPACMKKSA